MLKIDIQMVLRNIFFSLLAFLALQHSSLAQSFSNISSLAGVADMHDGDNLIDMRIGSGAAWLDYNNDGLQDLYMTFRTQGNKLYENRGDGTFLDVSIASNAQDASGDGGGVVVTDFNNDGWQDLFLANCQGNKLLKNMGDNTFTDITSTAFTDPDVTGPSRSPSASWGDYDNDGYLDLYVSQHAPSPSINPPPNATTNDFLFHNNGDETFTDVTYLLGAVNMTSWGFIAGWTDFDRDGDMDIIQINDCRPIDSPLFLPTTVFRNDGGTDPFSWSFTQASVSVGVDDCRSGMGVALGDYNRDGWTDFFYTNIGECILFKNEEGIFSDVSSFAGVNTQDGPFYSWGCSFADYDLDGWVDLSVMIGSYTGDSLSDPQPNQLFRNLGNGTFEDISAASNMDIPSSSRNGIYADYDNDGDLDMMIINYGSEPMLMLNNLDNGKHWSKINLEGGISNRLGVGAKIKLISSAQDTQYFEMRSGSNLGGGDALYAHFGLDTATSIQSLEIQWPSGIVQHLSDLDVDQMITVIEPDGISLNSHIFLDGPYQPSEAIMEIGANFQPPLIQPYNSSPYNYSGTESINSIYSSMIDWVFVEARSVVDSTNVLCKRAAILMADGSIVDVDGVSPLVLTGLGSGSYFISIQHRNHLGVLSNQSLQVVTGQIIADFRLGETYGTESMKFQIDGNYVMWSGNLDGNLIIDAGDRSEAWNTRNAAGYMVEDTNLDGVVDATERTITWNHRNKNGIQLNN